MIDVLIVEDDPMVQEINKMYLNEVEGYELRGIACSGNEAVNFLAKEEVDLILLDLILPDYDGFRLIAHIRQTQKDIDVMIITAASDMRNIHRALQGGAVDYIIKPFHSRRFKSALVKYREQLKIMREQYHLNQEELDRLIIAPCHPSKTENTFPKGLTKKTLKEVWNYIIHLNGQEFSTDELVGGLGLSRISVRKYLLFLEKIDVLISHSNYGSIGRPLTLYQCKHENVYMIEPYLD